MKNLLSLSLCVGLVALSACAVSPEYPQDGPKQTAHANMAVLPGTDSYERSTRTANPDNDKDICVGEWCRCESQ